MSLPDKDNQVISRQPKITILLNQILLSYSIPFCLISNGEVFLKANGTEWLDEVIIIHKVTVSANQVSFRIRYLVQE